MGWGKRLLTRIDPGLLVGVSLGDWTGVLWDNGFRIRPPYWPKVAYTTLLSLLNTPLRWLESGLYGRRVAAQEVLPLLFVLGHWRSGTTLLHSLLARDRRFAYPTYAQTAQPHHFLLTGRLGDRVIGLLRPPTRGELDNVALTVDAPEEEEFLLCRTSLLSPYLSWAFPANSDRYDRYLTFRDVPGREVERWKAAFVRLARRLTYRLRRPLIFKSPPNTCRIRLLLEAFPDARFVHIHRDPYTVYQSTRRMLQVSEDFFAFQRADPARLHDRILRQYRVMYDAFFEERGLIPAGRYCEVGFEELEADPVGVLGRIYEELSLPDFAVARPALEDHVKSLSGYKKNRHAELPPELRGEIAGAWRRCFDEWKYPV
jgi:hypothetical protein